MRIFRRKLSVVEKIMPEISLVIPSWDAASLLEQTLPAALAQEGVDYEVIVVDNGSPNRDSIAVVEKLAKAQKTPIRAVEMANQAGYTGAVNAGVLASKAKYVAILGNDNQPTKDWLCSLWKAITETKIPLTGAAMSQTIVSGNIPPGPCTLNLIGRNIFFNDPDWETHSTKTFYPGGNAFIFERQLFQAPFEDFYFAYQEDVSFGWRVHLKGMEVLQVASPRVASFDGGSLKRKSVRYRSLVLTERNRILNCLSFPEWHTLIRLFPLLLLDAAAAFIFGNHRQAKISAWAWILLNPAKLLQLRMKRQAERLVPDRVAMKDISQNYFSTATEVPEGISSFKRAVNFAVAAYCRVLFIPGSRHF